MASHAAQVYRGIKDKILSRLPASLNVQTVMLADPYRIGPELIQSLQGGQVKLNVLVISPLTGTVQDSDAFQNTEVTRYPWQFVFVYQRATDLEEVIDRLADGLHSHLNLWEFRDLNKLGLYIETPGEHGKEHQPVGRVRQFSVGAVDFDPPENAIMFELSGGSLAAFTIPFEVVARVSKDWRTRTP